MIARCTPASALWRSGRRSSRPLEENLGRRGHALGAITDVEHGAVGGES